VDETVLAGHVRPFQREFGLGCWVLFPGEAKDEPSRNSGQHENDSDQHYRSDHR
jgi:hypothetical protein